MNSIIKEIEVDFHWLYLVKLTIPPHSHFKPTSALSHPLPPPFLPSPSFSLGEGRTGGGGGCITAGTI